MKKLFHSNAGLILLIALLLAALTLTVSVLLSGADPVADLLGIVTTPFRNAGAAFGNWVEDIADSRYRADQLQDDLQRLRLELSQMEEQARQGQSAIEENKNLRQLLGLKQRRSELELENVTITARNLSNWEASCTISKGSLDGLEANQCVIDAYGNLVGVIREVGLNWSTMITLVDTDIDMGGIVTRTNAAALLEGDFSLMTQGRLKLSYLPSGAKLMVGDEVLTSGRGGVYPAGLVVGNVESIQEDPSGMTNYAVITPKADLSTLRQVFVIKSFDIVE